MDHHYRSVKHIYYDNARDHLLHVRKDKCQYWEPTILNTDSLKMTNGITILSHVRTFLHCLLSEHIKLVEILVSNKKNSDRVTHSLDFGLHTTDSGTMTAGGEMSTMGPGLIKKAFKIPFHTRYYMGHFLVGLENILFQKIGKEDTWLGNQERNKF